MATKHEVAKKAEAGKPAKKKLGFKGTLQKAKKFFGEVMSELKKVTWPTRKDLIAYSVAVAVFVAIFAILCGGVDWIFNALLGLVIS